MTNHQDPILQECIQADVKQDKELREKVKDTMNDYVNAMEYQADNVRYIVDDMISLIHTAVIEAKREALEVSDGYHTFTELYEHRHALFSIICRDYNGWKSKLHDDGTMFDGWFISGVETPQGQATYHLPLLWWDKFKCRERDKAPKWDGHTPKDVIARIIQLKENK